MWHMKSLSSKWLLRWIFKLAKQENFDPQKSHLYFLIPVCVTKCCESCPPLAKFLLQIWHRYGFCRIIKFSVKIDSTTSPCFSLTSPEWTRKCKRNLSLTGNCFPHMSQLKVTSVPCCEARWFFKQPACRNFFPHSFSGHSYGRSSLK